MLVFDENFCVGYQEEKRETEPAADSGNAESSDVHEIGEEAGAAHYIMVCMGYPPEFQKMVHF